MTLATNENLKYMFFRENQLDPAIFKAKVLKAARDKGYDGTAGINVPIWGTDFDGSSSTPSRRDVWVGKTANPSPMPFSMWIPMDPADPNYWKVMQYDATGMLGEVLDALKPFHHVY